MQPDQSNEELANLDKQWQETRQNLVINGFEPRKGFGLFVIIRTVSIGVVFLVAWAYLTFTEHGSLWGFLGEFAFWALILAVWICIGVCHYRRGAQYEAAEADYKRRRRALLQK